MENAADVLSSIYYDYMQNKLGKGNPIEKAVEQLMFDFGGKDVDGLAVYAIPAGGKTQFRCVTLDKKGAPDQKEQKELDEFIKKSKPTGPVYFISMLKKKNVKNMPLNLDEKLEGGRGNIICSAVKIYGEAGAGELKKLALEKFESKAATWIALQEFSRYTHHMQMMDRILGGHFITVPVVNMPKKEAFNAVFWGRIDERPNDRKRSIRVYVEKNGWAQDEALRDAVQEQYGKYCAIVGGRANIFFMTPRFIDLASKGRADVIDDEYFKEWETVDILTCMKTSDLKKWEDK
ncbi:Uncharacterised protein [Candidatus Gugararchaeum adminiculabundum]|nr:Uncharacterised protein [Candidatus Gugararchaeum adminiculabundum]